jgi:glycogen operon protein
MVWFAMLWLGCGGASGPDGSVGLDSAPVDSGSPDTDTDTVVPTGDDDDDLPAVAAWGPRVEAEVLHFAVPTGSATRVEVWIYADPGDAEPSHTLVLEPVQGGFAGQVGLDELAAVGVSDVWYGLRAWGPNWPYDEAWVPGSEVGFVADVDSEGHRFDPNKLLVDPWARELSHDPGPDWTPYTSGAQRAVDTGPLAPKGLAFVTDLPAPSDGPDTPLRDTVVYEVHLRGLTMLDETVPEALRGTYAGAALKAPYLAELGVTAVEFLPLAETFNDQNELTPDSVEGDNYWGYSTLLYFAPDRRFAADQRAGGPTREFAGMVEAFHAEGIEVFVDVVYNHTAEGGTWGDPDTAPLLSWRGLDNPGYYQLDGPEGYRSDNGVGPNLNMTSEPTRAVVLDSLAWWADTLGVDGFRYDLAPILGNACAQSCFDWSPDDPDGLLMRIDAEIDAKHIAEPWGATGDAYRVGDFPGDWAEWNDGFRDTTRRDLNRLGVEDVTLGTVADVWSGSWGRFGDDGRQPWHSVNFVTAHDGMTLFDLMSCNAKDNDQPWAHGPSDGGTDYDLSWDQGGEPAEQRRAMRTAMALLTLSAGVPMILGGDEFGRTQRCNNNTYNLDSEANWLGWTHDADQQAFTEFTRALLALRAEHDVLRPDTWRGSEAVWWAPDGSVASSDYLAAVDHHALGLQLGGLFIGFNGWSDMVTFSLPPTPSGGVWHLAVDTSVWLEGEGNVLQPATALPDASYGLHGRGLVVLTDGP